MIICFGFLCHYFHFSVSKTKVRYEVGINLKNATGLIEEDAGFIF